MTETSGIIGRRGFLIGASATAFLVTTAGQAEAGWHRPGNPFTLGVASGDPLPTSVVLWTRLAPDPLNGGGMPDRPVPVLWQVARDERFRRVERRGLALARPQTAHSVHIDVKGLDPGRDYFYRFFALGEISPVGRTRTAPRNGADVAALSFGVVNCQDWQNGRFPAYAGLAAEDLDVVLHVGDYIYEGDPQPGAIRQHTTPEQPGLNQLRTLADYRNRHAQYKTDPALQAAHAAFPFVVTWDDHEVENNYANDIDEVDDSGDSRQDPATFRAQRAAAYQAYWEHMPIRASYTIGSADFLIYRRFDYGDLARVNVLDTRQYRTDQPCGVPSDLGPVFCGTSNAAGTLTGETQEQWLRDGLADTTALWNVLAQQTILAQTRFLNPTQVPPQIANLDQWDGYVPFRTRTLEHVRDAAVPNPIVLTGDIHSAWVNDLRPNFDDPASPIVGTEFVATSVTSEFPPPFIPIIIASNAALNPHVRYFDGTTHGYLRCDVDRSTWRTQFRVVDSIASESSPVRTSASWVVEAGQPGAMPG